MTPLVAWLVYLGVPLLIFLICYTAIKFASPNDKDQP